MQPIKNIDIQFLLTLNKHLYCSISKIEACKKYTGEFYQQQITEKKDWTGLKNEFFLAADAIPVCNFSICCEASFG